jgi:hypothetical protein
VTILHLIAVNFYVMGVGSSPSIPSGSVNNDNWSVSEEKEAKTIFY